MALHVAAVFNGSLEVNRRLYELYPPAIHSPSKPHGRLPLHESVWFANNVEVAAFYLREFPLAARRATSEGYTPLHFLLETPHMTPQRMDCLRLLLRENPSAAIQTDNDGETPLSVSRKHRHGPQVTKGYSLVNELA